MTTNGINPIRYEIVKILTNKPQSLASISKMFGYNTDRMRNIMDGMQLSRMASKVMIGNASYWTKYVKPPKVKRVTPILPGTVKGRLTLGYMTVPVRAGSMDAYQIASRGIG